jgi:hypothetical protein
VEARVCTYIPNEIDGFLYHGEADLHKGKAEGPSDKVMGKKGGKVLDKMCKGL